MSQATRAVSTKKAEKITENRIAFEILSALWLS